VIGAWPAKLVDLLLYRFVPLVRHETSKNFHYLSIDYFDSLIAFEVTALVADMSFYHSKSLVPVKKSMDGHTVKKEARQNAIGRLLGAQSERTVLDK
jgi:hypothetical protein